MEIRPIEFGDVVDISMVHANALPWSINGRLGRSHLMKVYTQLLNGPDCLGYVALHKGKIVAFQVSSTNWRRVRERLGRMATRDKLRVAIGCLRHPSDFIALFESVFLVPRAFQRSGVSAEIVAWAAQPDNPIASVGAHRCLLYSIAELARRGEERCLGQMQKPNERPMAYLRRLSPKIISRYLRNDVLVFDCEEATRSQPVVSSFNRV